jgi:hypothetical protein
MFVTTTTAQRIERAEAETTRAMAAALVGSTRAPDAFVRQFAGGWVAYVRQASPMNKVIGAGLDAILDENALAAVEAALHDKGEPVRVELATLALPEVARQLTARGYRLIGFENVLARGLDAEVTRRAGPLRIERVHDGEALRVWRDTLLEGFASADASGVPADVHTRAVIEAVVDDVLAAPGFDRYVARVDGVVAGAASLCVRDGVALLTGSATLPAQRRRGVQAALIAARLDDARARGADLAIITTAPGTQSQANVMKQGFSLAYARAILVTEPHAPAR